MIIISFSSTSELESSSPSTDLVSSLYHLYSISRFIRFLISDHFEYLISLIVTPTDITAIVLASSEEPFIIYLRYRFQSQSQIIPAIKPESTNFHNQNLYLLTSQNLLPSPLYTNNDIYLLLSSSSNNSN